MKRILATSALVLFVGAFLLTAVVLVTVSSSPAEAAGGCRCPLIYAPVVCDKGKVYPNLCVAECHNAKNCVPTGGL